MDYVSTATVHSEVLTYCSTRDAPYLSSTLPHIHLTDSIALRSGSDCSVSVDVLVGTAPVRTVDDWELTVAAHGVSRLLLLLLCALLKLGGGM